MTIDCQLQITHQGSDATQSRYRFVLGRQIIFEAWENELADWAKNAVSAILLAQAKQLQIQAGGVTRFLEATNDGK